MLSRQEEMRVEQLRREQDEMMEKYGYVIHVVPGETVHTHGLEKYQHAEIECVLPMDPRVIQTLVHDLGERVKKGEKFSDGELLYDVIKSLPVKLVACSHGLRLILPDSKGNLERDQMEKAYADQYVDLWSDEF